MIACDQNCSETPNSHAAVRAGTGEARSSRAQAYTPPQARAPSTALDRCPRNAGSANGGQTRISVASPSAGLSKQMGDALSRQAIASSVAERVVGRGLAFFVEPLAQAAAGPGPQRYGPLLAALPEELHNRGGAEAYIGALYRHEHGDTHAGDTDSITFDVRRWRQCSAGKSKNAIGPGSSGRRNASMTDTRTPPTPSGSASRCW